MASTWHWLSTVPTGLWIAVGFPLSLFLILQQIFYRELRGWSSVYFDPQDFVHYEGGAGRELPVSASTDRFEAQLRNYIDVAKLQITVAAASIAFGANQSPKTGILIAKVILASSILYGVLFCALLQYFYDEYGQNVRAYTRFRYSLIQALGFSTLVCFIAGYFVWAFNL